uniref:Uncharacterized protein n=1 Tax=Rangifer tarandus platyrhynchus TaxID=3082113 RepID=A0ACB0EMM1_RANTA|nr:unnamed protein product [Rangifer tarandus platyrhynchus]
MTMGAWMGEWEWGGGRGRALNSLANVHKSVREALGHQEARSRLGNPAWLTPPGSQAPQAATQHFLRGTREGKPLRPERSRAAQRGLPFRGEGETQRGPRREPEVRPEHSPGLG